MANRRLAKYVTCLNPESGEGVTFTPGTQEEDMPKWAFPMREDAWAAGVAEAANAMPTSQSNYSNYTVPELLELTRDRDLESPSRKKSDLIETLEAADHASDNS